MIERIISGFQTGADEAGARAAKRFGIACGGWMPRGWLTEAGPRPEFDALYNAQEHKSDKYPPRTWANVLSADATLWFGEGDSAGQKCTLAACHKGPRPYLIVLHGARPGDVADWLEFRDNKIVNIAGNRESKSPGIGARVEGFLCRVFRRLGFEEQA